MLIRQNTAIDIMLGPFVSSTDGVTPQTALTITQPDILLSKNGAAFAQKNAAQTLVHGSNGWYPANLNATDTNTLGQLIVAVYETGALPVWREFQVIPALVYDSLVAGSDNLQVDTIQVTGTAQTAGDLMGVLGALNVAAAAGDPGTTTTLVAYLKQIVNTLEGTAGIPTYPAAVNPANGVSLAEAIRAIRDAVTNVQADTDDVQTRLPAALVGGRIDASVGAMAANVLTGAAADPTLANEIADQVWDELIAGHLGAGSTGAALNGAGAGGDPWGTALPGAYGAGSAGAILGNNLNATVGSRATPADVLAETNAALDTAIALPVQAAPPAAPSLRQGVAYLFKAWRNRTRQTKTAYELYSEDGATVDHKAALSANANEVIRDEVGSGP